MSNKVKSILNTWSQNETSIVLSTIYKSGRNSNMDQTIISVKKPLYVDLYQNQLERDSKLVSTI